MSVKTFHIDDGQYSLWASAISCGSDLSITVCGGSAPHIGAVAMGIPRPSLRQPDKTSASVSVLCVTGHKDDEFARLAAQQIASRQRCVVSVNVGIHIDDANESDILRFQQNFEHLVADILASSV